LFCCRLSDSLEGVGHADVTGIGVGGDISRQILVLQCFDAILKSLDKLVADEEPTL
jgi:hypothetical protein